MLFSDIRGFSAMAEGLPPEQLVALLNSYFEAMAAVVLDHRGLLDKYIGDAVLAVYGAPLPSPDHAYDACRTALAMVARLEAVRQEWSAKGLPRIGIGIGIVTGRMVVGNVGSQQRFDYTVIGDGVNLARGWKASTRPTAPPSWSASPRGSACGTASGDASWTSCR